MNLLTLFFGIFVVFIVTISIFFDNVEASALPNALAAPDALADADALPLALPKRKKRKGSKFGKNILTSFGKGAAEAAGEATVNAAVDQILEAQGEGEYLY
uniref:Venom peptide n=1 Tax=Dasymutilla klugii TaxID=1175364 RepID=A0A8T9VJJ8_DASKL|nr:venom peptide precursor [Dasymutilla klugii]